MAELQSRNDQPTNAGDRSLGKAVTKGLDVFLGTSLFAALLLHSLHETGKLFASPLSDRLQGKPTFLWVLGAFVVWVAWRHFTGRGPLRTKPRA